MNAQDEAMRPTMIKRIEQYKDRWSSYGANTGILELSEKLSPQELKRYEIFKEYDDKFLEKLSPDVSVAKWKKGAILFEEGSYLNLAFFILQGTVEVYISKLQQQAQSSQPIFDASRTMVVKEAPDMKAAADPREMYESVLSSQIQKKDESSQSMVFLSVMDFNLPISGRFKLGPGDFLGEIGALSGWPQSVTARATSECEVIQIRVAALRLMRKRSKAFKERVDQVYRERTLSAQLKQTPLLQKCDSDFIDALAKKVDLVSYEPDDVILREGEAADALYLVRSGFVKLSQKFGEGRIVVSYLSKGMTLGEVELLVEESNGWTYTAASLEYSELVKISRADLQTIFNKFPNIKQGLWESAITRIKEVGYSKKNLGQSAFIETALRMGLMQGNSMLAIDMNVCTRCNDCMRACADTHGGRPRFIREGDKYENFLIARSCYHCRDPVCLAGCPTGAIHRTNIGDVVAINDKLCIGCQSCANNCPYDAIVMHQTGEVWPSDAIPEGLRGKERLLASKCDLCSSTGHGPACVSNCPHGCAVRVGSLDEFQQLLLSKSHH